MDALRWTKVSEVFEQALELPPAARSAFLDRACEDQELRREVERMLSAEEHGAEFLVHPAEGAAASGAPEPDPAGRRVGDCELVRLIASGGMGSVYEAVQQQPRRRVALKMLRPGLAGEEYLLRFRREVEVLAILNHPGIAQIHEAGVHEEPGTGGLLVLPWFTMEYVEDARGLLAFAEEQRLDPAARLELFVEVCAAVQHGHQKGVIHRDLKPSNILVDGAGRAKVIDFGIALATAEETQVTRHTAVGQVLGTLRYMSPEQLGGLREAVDTRSDVYALGVILYELLCGRTPFLLDGLPLTEAARVVREEPPRSPLDAKPGLPRELAWILLRCLEKEPARRYSTVAELAADVRRFTAHEPVLAGPPTALYRVGKFVRRNRGAVLAATAIAVLLVVGLVATSLGLAERGRLLAASEERREQAEREAAKLAAVNEYVRDMLESANPWEVGGREVRMADVLAGTAGAIDGRFPGMPDVESSLRATLGASYVGLGMLPEAEAQLRAALELARIVHPAGHPERLKAMRDLALVLVATTQLEEAEALARETLAAAEDSGDLFQVMNSRKVLAQVLMSLGRFADSEAQLELGLAESADRAEQEASTSVVLESTLCGLYIEQGRFAKAEDLARRILEELPDSDLRQELPIQLMLTSSLIRQGRLDEAAPSLEDLRGRVVRMFGPDHPDLAKVLLRSAVLEEQRGHLAAAEELDRELLRIHARGSGLRTVAALRIRFNLAVVLDKQRRVDESDEVLGQVAEDQLAVLGAGHPDTLRSLSYLARKAVIRDADEASLRIADFLGAAREVASDAVTPVLEEFCDVVWNHAARGRFAEGVEFLRDLRESQLRLEPPQGLGVLRTTYFLARALRRTGQQEAALSLLRDMLPAQREALAPGHPYLVETLSELSALLLELRRESEAEAPAREALQYADRTPGAKQANALTLAHSLAWILVRSERPDEARVLLESELALVTVPNPVTACAEAKVCELLAELMYSAGQVEVAAEGYGRAVELALRCHGDGHAEVLRLQARFDVLHAELGQ